MKFVSAWMMAVVLGSVLMACGSSITSGMPTQTLSDPNAPGPGKGHGPADPNGPKPPGPPDPNAPPPPALNCQTAAFQGMPSPVICGNVPSVMLHFTGPFTAEPNITITSGTYGVSGVTQAAPGPCTFSFAWDPNGVANGNYTATLTEAGSNPVTLPFEVSDTPGCQH